MKVVIWFFVLLIAIPVIFVTGIFIHNKSIGPVGWAEDNTFKALRAKMKDPDSMTIKSSFVIQKINAGGDTEIFVCGIVDGKNSFGGYTGGARFASRSVSGKGTFDTYTVEMEDMEKKALASSVKLISAFEKVYWNDFCVDAAHPPITAP